jgi:hypothetical protein
VKCTNSLYLLEVFFKERLGYLPQFGFQNLLCFEYKIRSDIVELRCMAPEFTKTVHGESFQLLCKPLGYLPDQECADGAADMLFSRFDICGVAANDAAAVHGAVFIYKSPDKAAGSFLCRFPFPVAVVAAVFQADGHQRAGKGAADIAVPADTSSKGGGDPGDYPGINVQVMASCQQHRFTAVVVAGKVIRGQLSDRELCFIVIFIHGLRLPDLHLSFKITLSATEFIDPFPAPG